MSKINENRPGYKQTKVGWIPKEWKLIQLREIGNFYKGKGITKRELVDKGLPAVRYGELYTTFNTTINEIASQISKSSAENSKLARKGDILFPGSGETPEEIGKPSVLLIEKAWISGDTIAFSTKNQDPLFLAYALNSFQAIKERAKVAQGVSVVHIYPRDLKESRLPLPPLSEQKKIATILSTWDAAIRKLDQLIERKQALKKGLMQQLLTGQRRFPEFVPEGGTRYQETKLGLVPEDWEVVKFGNICQIKGRIGYRGYTKKDIVPKGKGAIALSPSNIKDRTLSFLNCTYISWFKYEESPEIQLKENDILLVKTGSTYGKTALVKNLPEKSTINPQLVVIKEIKCDEEFLSYVMSFQVFQKQIKSTVVGGAIPTLSQETISKFYIPLPSSSEQLKIAKTLRVCDLEIESLRSSNSRFQQQKKGLMQQLLTGAVRVNI